MSTKYGNFVDAAKSTRVGKNLKKLDSVRRFRKILFDGIDGFLDASKGTALLIRNSPDSSGHRKCTDFSERPFVTKQNLVWIGVPHHI